MKVYRWEDKDGLGPFQSSLTRGYDRTHAPLWMLGMFEGGWLNNTAKGQPQQYDGTPLPRECTARTWDEWKEGRDRRNDVQREPGDIIFGFNTKESARDYFGNSVELFVKLGLKFVEYEVPKEHLYSGDWQCCWIEDYGKRIGEVDYFAWSGYKVGETFERWRGDYA